MINTAKNFNVILGDVCAWDCREILFGAMLRKETAAFRLDSLDWHYGNAHVSGTTAGLYSVARLWSRDALPSEDRCVIMWCIIQVR